MFHVKCFSWKIFEQTSIDMAYLHIFLIALNKEDTAAEMYLELFQTYVLEHGLRYKGSILTGMVLNTLCSYRNIIWYYKRNETRVLHSS